LPSIDPFFRYEKETQSQNEFIIYIMPGRIPFRTYVKSYYLKIDVFAKYSMTRKEATKQNMFSFASQPLIPLPVRAKLLLYPSCELLASRNGQCSINRRNHGGKHLSQ
jgi:hypothetical protein